MFSKETEYAIRGLVYIQLQNNKQRRPGLAEIAKEIDAPPFFTAKILQRLVKQGALSSVKGKGGGFFFTPDQQDLSLLSVVQLTGGSKSLESCGIGLKNCDCEHPCPLHEKFAPIRSALNMMVSTESIQSLAKKYNHE